MKKIRAALSKPTEILFATILVLISGIFHAYNMFHFPFFENDEGTYLAQAWSFLSQGHLAPYTYWYDHAPFGWIFTSLWIFLTGGLFTFGFSLNSARVFMLLIHLCNCALLYVVSKKVTRSKLATFICLFFFSVSPLAVYFQRRLLLDNLMIFWILITLTFIFNSKSKLRHFILSAITFAFAVLTKENAIFFFPVLLYLVYRKAHPAHRTIALIKWLCITGAVISVYPLYALLKGELFPMGSIFSPLTPHVSLLGTLAMQSARGSGLAIWNTLSDFQINLRYWIKEDSWFVIGGFASFIIHGLLGIKSKSSRLVFLLTLPEILFLCSGKLVINFYIIAVVPFLALSIGLLCSHIFRLISKLHIVPAHIFAFLFVVVLIHHYQPLTVGYLTKDETGPQVQAVDWMKKNIDPNKHISIDFYSYLDLTNVRFAGDPVFKNADWFWKVELDPDITEKKLHNNYKNIDYVMITAEAQRQIPNFAQNSLLRKVLQSSQIVQEFSNDDAFSQNFNLNNQTMPNGDWVVMYQQQSLNLQKSWNTYKNRYMKNNFSYVQAPEQKGSVISEAQSYALLRAVWMNDQSTFDSTYSWTKSHMQLKSSHLFGWKWIEKSDTLVDQGNAPDADQDIALSLLFAAKRWNNPAYEQDAKAIINDIWTSNVYHDDEYTFVTAGNWAISKDYVTINPSYFAPYAYREFAKVDPTHDWNAVVDSSYAVLNKCSSSLLGRNYNSFLPPEWCRFEFYDRAFVASDKPQPEGTEYGYNAFRIPWKLYLDYQWNNEPRAYAYLKSMDFLVWQYSQNSLVNVFSHEATPLTKDTQYAYIMNLPVFLSVDQKVAHELLKQHILPEYHETETDAYWQNGDDYYLQNWSWFAMGIYQGELTDLAK